jgi:hypothetical protein
MSLELKVFTMIKAIIILLFMNFSLAALGGEVHSGTRFLLEDYDDLVALKLELREKGVDHILEKPVLRKSKFGNELIYQVCVGFIFIDGYRPGKSQVYHSEMPSLENPLVAPKSNFIRGCDVNAEEYEL